jgi:hypothetical protein
MINGSAKPSSSSECARGSAYCSAHGFSATGEADDWTYIGGPDAPYNFSSVTSAGTLREFSTRERPWGLLHNGEWLALINGVSEATPLVHGVDPLHLKYLPGRDWTYTNIQPVRHDNTLQAQ